MNSSDLFDQLSAAGRYASPTIIPSENDVIAVTKPHPYALAPDVNFVDHAVEPRRPQVIDKH